MRRLIFINRFFFPDHSATSQILSDLAFHLADTGQKVLVVTSKQSYGDAKPPLPDYEVIRNVHVHRVFSTRLGCGGGLLGRTIEYFSFGWSLWRRLPAIAQPGDIVVAKTDPPLLSIVAMAAARRSGLKLVNWLQDVYPELAVKLGVRFIRGPVATGLAGLRNRSLQFADAIVVPGDLMGQRIEALGIPRQRIHFIPNWCNDEEIKPLGYSENSLRQRWGLQDKFVVGYSGNLGRAHEFSTVLGAAEQLGADPRIVFLMIGGGTLFSELADIVKVRRLEHLFRFLPYQEQKVLRYSLTASDVHWISLNPKAEGLIVPSKFYGIAAAGKPIIVIAAKDGELARLVQEYACGAVIDPGDAGALVRTLLRLSNDPAAVAAMGMRARKMLEVHFSRQKAFELWSRLLDTLNEGVVISKFTPMVTQDSVSSHRGAA